MKRIFAIIGICIGLYSCKTGIPNDVIQPDKMEKVLYDMHIVDGYLSLLQKPNVVKKAASKYYNGVYKKFDIDSASYTKSMDYYYQRPDLLNNMYQNLIKQLDQERVKNDKRLSKEASDLRKKELAKSTKVLVVPAPISGPPKLTMGTNPFMLVSEAVK